MQPKCRDETVSTSHLTVIHIVIAAAFEARWPGALRFAPSRLQPEHPAAPEGFASDSELRTKQPR
jgi:hypothetical protein